MATGPGRPPSRSADRSRLATAGSIFALVILLFVIGALLLVLPLLGFIGLAILIGTLVFGAMIAAHYLVWGRWVARQLDKDKLERE